MGGTRIRLAAIAALVLGASSFLAIASSGAGAASDDFELEITTCPPGQEPDQADPSQCQEETQDLPPPEKKKPPNVDQPKPDVTDVDLGTGDKTTKAPGSDELDLNLEARDDEGNIVPVGQDEIPTPGTATPVTTTGGSTPGITGASPFDFISQDAALRSYTIPPFLLHIYVDAGQAYGIPWNVLAAINKIETDFGRVGACAVSSADAKGWMQFIDSTWAMYGVDASGDGYADQCNPVDAIYAAARYLRACSPNLREAIFCYNHADWYVDDVLQTASVYGSLPGGIVVETGSLAYGEFPVKGPVSYGDDFREAELTGATPEGLRIYPEGAATAVATQNVTVTRVLISPELAEAFRRDPGRVDSAIVKDPDAKAAPAPPAPPPPPAPAAPAPTEKAEGNSESGGDGSLAQAARVVATIPRIAAASGLTDLVAFGLGDDDSPAVDPPPPTDDPVPTVPATGEGLDAPAPADAAPRPKASDAAKGPKAPSAAGPKIEPGDPGLPDGYEVAKGGGVGVEVTDPVGNRYRYEGLVKLQPEVRPGAELGGGDKLGPLDAKKPVLFSLTGASGGPVDPRPIVDSHRLCEVADCQHPVEPLGGSPFILDEGTLAAGIVDGSQAQLASEVLNDPGISIYDCGRGDVEQGIVDKRVLGALLYLRRSGLTLTVTSLRCGHSYYTAGGSVSAHSYGAAVDIAAFNDEPVIGNQGPGSLTEFAIQQLCQLEGAAQPAQLISLMSGICPPSFALSDHADHLHVGYEFDASLGLGRSGEVAGDVHFGADAGGGQGLTKPEQGADARKHEQKLSEQLGKIENPEVPSKASPGATSTIEGEKRGDRKATEHGDEHGPELALTPTSTGAETVAIDSPEGQADEAYAIGVIDGSTRGWADDQSVILARRDGTWRLVGPPADAKGAVANLKLTELATVAGGRGYAVGEKGALVELRGDKPPLVLDSKVSSDLEAVDAVADGGKLSGYAAGGEGRIIRLTESTVDRERAGSGSTTLEAVSASKELAAASSAGEGAALYGRDADGKWSPVAFDLGVGPNAVVKLKGLDASGDQVWVAGSLAESAATPYEVPFAARRGGNGAWTTYCSTNPALSVIEELGEQTRGPCDHVLPTDGGSASAGAVEATPEGALVGAGSLLTSMTTGSAERTLAAAPEPISDLATSSLAKGLALGNSGRLVQFGSGAAAADGGQAVELPLGSAEDVVGASAGPGRAIALGGGKAAIGGPEGWELTDPTGLAARDVAWSADGQPWAIDELGLPIALGEDGWAGEGEDDEAREERAALAEQIGGSPLAAPEDEPESGLRALAFAESGAGFAVGPGLIAVFGGNDWRYLPTDAALSDVAAGPGGVIAVGDDGVLLEVAALGSDGGLLDPDGQGWMSSDEAAALSRGSDLTAAAALADGTMLAAGGGVILAKEPGGDWSALDLPPLGSEVRRLAGTRSEDELKVFVLVESGPDLVLLESGEDGWRPADVPDGVTVSDISPVPGSDGLLITGDRSGRAVAVEIGAGGTAAEGDANGDTGSGE